MHDLRLLVYLVRFGPMDNSEGQYPGERDGRGFVIRRHPRLHGTDFRHRDGRLTDSVHDSVDLPLADLRDPT